MRIDYYTVVEILERHSEEAKARTHLADPASQDWVEGMAIRGELLNIRSEILDAAMDATIEGLKEGE